MTTPTPDLKAARDEILQLASRILVLCPTAGLYAEIKLHPSGSKSAIAAGQKL